MDKETCFLKVVGIDHDGYGLEVTGLEKIDGDFPPEGFAEKDDITVGFMDLSEQPASPGDYTTTECDRVAIAAADHHEIAVEIDPEDYARVKEAFDDGSLIISFE